MIRIPASCRSGGFTLVELAVVLAIVALLIGGLLMPLSAQDEMRRTAETQKTLKDIHEALIGYAASHHASDGKPIFPCPDTDNDGLPDLNGAGDDCASQEGRIPWVDLGVGLSDPWGNRFRYRVASVFTKQLTGFTLGTSGDIRICSDAACATRIATAVPLVVLSHGRNGAGAFNADGGVNPAPAGANEKQNVDGDSDFVSTTPASDYDDIVLWLSPNILFNRMIAAGRLP